MLVLSRKTDERIVIGDNIAISVVEVRGGKVRLGIEAPREVTTHRQDVIEAINREIDQPSHPHANFAAPLAPADPSRPESQYVVQEGTKKYIWVPHHIKEARHTDRSCFISYSHRDEQFVKKLYEEMRRAEMPVWYAPENMKGGRKTHEQIESAIKKHDKLVLVLSQQFPA